MSVLNSLWSDRVFNSEDYDNELNEIVTQTPPLHSYDNS